MIRRSRPFPEGERMITVMGIAGETYWEAFRGWVTRVRRHIGWRLLRPEIDRYLRPATIEAAREGWDMKSRSWHRFNALNGLATWVQGPSGWETLSLWGWLTRGIWNRHRQE